MVAEQFQAHSMGSPVSCCVGWWGPLWLCVGGWDRWSGGVVAGGAFCGYGWLVWHYVGLCGLCQIKTIQSKLFGGLWAGGGGLPLAN